VIWAVVLMQNVPLDAVFLFDLHAAILGWLLSAVQPKKQYPRLRFGSTDLDPKIPKCHGSATLKKQSFLKVFYL
jgi:hypothetical protein